MKAGNAVDPVWCLAFATSSGLTTQPCSQRTMSNIDVFIKSVFGCYRDVWGNMSWQ